MYFIVSSATKQQLILQTLNYLPAYQAFRPITLKYHLQSQKPTQGNVNSCLQGVIRQLKPVYQDYALIRTNLPFCFGANTFPDLWWFRACQRMS